MGEYVSKEAVLTTDKKERFKMITGYDYFCILYADRIEPRRMILRHKELQKAGLNTKDSIEKEIVRKMSDFFEIEKQRIVLWYHSQREIARVESIAKENAQMGN